MSKKGTSIESQVSALAALRDRLGEQSFARPAVSRLADAGKALADIVSVRTADTPERRAKRVSDAADSYLKSVQRTRTDLQARELGGFATLNSEFAERVGMDLNGFRFTDAVLNSFKNANQTEKTSMLASIVESGDGKSLAVLLESPAFTHGVDAEMLSRFKSAMEAKHAPDVSEKRERFQADVEAARTAVNMAEQLAKEALAVDNISEALEAAEQTSEAEQRLADATA